MNTSPEARGVRKRGRLFLIVCALSMSVVVGAPAGASPTFAALGRVSVVPPDADELQFRSAVHHEFEQTLGLHAPRRRVVVTVTLTRLESRGPSPSCAVSVVVMDAKGGSVIAVADGGARADSRIGDARPLLRAAIRSAFAQVVRAIP